METTSKVKKISSAMFYFTNSFPLFLYYYYYDTEIKLSKLQGPLSNLGF